MHARRHEAELRLKAAETNLLRVEDVVKQLASQMDALKRQARQAIRYRNVSSEVRKVEAMLFHLRWRNANAEIEETERAKDLSVRASSWRKAASANRAIASGATSIRAMSPLW